MYVGQNFERGQYDHTTLIYQNYSTEVKEFRWAEKMNVEVRYRNFEKFNTNSGIKHEGQ